MPVKIGGLAAGEQAYVTVAAVDVGILNLTRYKPPEPENYYYDQKRLTAELRDLYGQLIDGMQGDARPHPLRRRRRRRPAARRRRRSRRSACSPAWSQVGADGTAEVDFDIPAFNGTVRVMAVAWTQGQGRPCRRPM